MKQSSGTAVRELLLESYDLDPGSVEYLVEQALLDGNDGPVSLTCSILRESELSDVQQENLGEFVKRASARPAVSRRFQNSLRRMGRCPQSAKRWLRSQLAPPEEPSPPSHVVPRLTEPGPGTLLLNDESWSFDRFPDLLDRIASVIPTVRQVDVSLGSFTYASALAVLAQWLLVSGRVDRHRITCPPEMLAYLERIRFSAALRNREIKVSPDFMDWAVGLTRINEDLPTEAVTAKIVDIIDTFIHPTEEAKQAFEIMIAEMIENVHRHAEATVDGFAVAQVYPGKLKMGITFVDGGIGVRRSFEDGEPSVSIENLKSDADFLREACRLHSTSKSSRHSGYGLFLLSEVVARNRGTFMISSGTATLIAYLRGGQVVFDSYSHKPWQGTIVSVIIDLRQRLPILDVYRAMPESSEVFTDEIFFSPKA